MAFVICVSASGTSGVCYLCLRLRKASLCHSLEVSESIQVSPLHNLLDVGFFVPNLVLKRDDAALLEIALHFSSNFAITDL